MYIAEVAKHNVSAVETDTFYSEGWKAGDFHIMSEDAYWVASRPHASDAWDSPGHPRNFTFHQAAIS